MNNHLLFAGLAAVVVGCGATESSPAPVAEPAPGAPAPPPPAVVTKPALDHGEVSTTYPAFAPAMGQLVNNGGPVLKNPVIITITWADDPHLEALEGLGDTIGTSPYWRETTSEYGSGPAVSGEANHVRLPDAPPASLSDAQLTTLVQANVANGTFPTPATGEPIYILYLQKATQLMLSGKSACSQGIGGYHDSTKVGGTSVAYAIVPRCGSSFDSVTIAASHELVEAASDPFPHSRPAWRGFREDDLAWDIFQQFQNENADACEFYRDSDLKPGVESGLAVTVQRSWSNKSAAAGRDPCLPALKDTTFFNTTPLGLEDIVGDLSDVGGSTVTTKGFRVAVGATRTIPLGLYSAGPTAPWTIKAITGGLAGGRSDLDLTLDVTEGQNGQKAYLDVTVNKAGKTGTELITIVSTRGIHSHYMPILIGR